MSVPVMNYQPTLLAGRYINLTLLDECWIQYEADNMTIRAMQREFTFLMNGYWQRVGANKALKSIPGYGKINLTINNRFCIGLLDDIIRLATRQGAKINFINRQDFINLSNNTGDSVDDDYISSLFHKSFLDKIGGKLYEYQYDGCKQVLKYKKGLVSMHVGAGKSVVVFALAKYLSLQPNLSDRNKVVIVVPTLTLAEQYYSDIMDYSGGEMEGKVAMCYSQAPKKLNTWDKPIIVTVRNTFKLRTQYHSQVKALIVDEAHELKCGNIADSKLNECIKNCNAEYKIALSGSFVDPFKESKPNMLEYYRVKQLFGKVLIHIEEKDGTENKRLTPFKIENIYYKYGDEDMQYQLAYSNYANTNKLIQEYKIKPTVMDYLINRSGKIKPEHNTIMIFFFKESLAMFKEYLETNYPEYEVFVITGDIKGKTREKYRQTISNKRGCFLLGTYMTISRGVNIKNIDNVILADGLKTQSGITQTIGRALRVTEEKELAMIYFLIDSAVFNRYNKFSVPIHQAKFRQQQFIDNDWNFKNIYIDENLIECVDLKVQKFIDDDSIVQKDC